LLHDKVLAAAADATFSHISVHKKNHVCSAFTCEPFFCKLHCFARKVSVTTGWRSQIPK